MCQIILEHMFRLCCWRVPSTHEMSIKTVRAARITDTTLEKHSIFYICRPDSTGVDRGSGRGLLGPRYGKHSPKMGQDCLKMWQHRPHTVSKRERERETERDRERERETERERDTETEKTETEKTETETETETDRDRDGDRDRDRDRQREEREREREDPALHRPKWAGARLLGVSLQITTVSQLHKAPWLQPWLRTR